jgi:ABC-type nickel/cobalt efflux system permease component RcnA
MAKRRKQSISLILIEFLSVLLVLKVFVLVLEYKVLHTTINEPYLDYGIGLTIFLLALRAIFVYWRYRARQSQSMKSDGKHKTEFSVDNTNFGVEPSIESFYCSTCGKKVSEKVRNYCLERPKKFNNKVYCFEHQSGL